MTEMNERTFVGYAIQDSYWPCGEIVNMNDNQAEKGIKLNYVVKKKEYPENFKRCMDEATVRKFFKEHIREINDCWIDGRFYVTEVYA